MKLYREIAEGQPLVVRTELLSGIGRLYLQVSLTSLPSPHESYQLVTHTCTHTHTNAHTHMHAHTHVHAQLGDLATATSYFNQVKTALGEGAETSSLVKLNA